MNTRKNAAHHDADVLEFRSKITADEDGGSSIVSDGVRLNRAFCTISDPAKRVEVIELAEKHAFKV